QSPADLDGGGEGRLERDRLQPREPLELPRELDRPQTPAALVEGAGDAVERRVGRRAVESRREELHDLRVGAHRRPRLPIRLAPLPQEQPFGAENRRHAASDAAATTSSTPAP